METINLHQATKVSSGKIVWTGRVISGICILFLFVDGVMKIFLNHYHVDGTTQLGWHASAVQPIGIVLVTCTVLHVIPRTSLIGALLLTGYLGGAVAIMARIGLPFYFPLVLAVLLWIGLCLRNDRLRELLMNQK
jgi:hypothetical protein